MIESEITQDQPKKVGPPEGWAERSKKYSFNMWDLEDAVIESHARWIETDNQTTRINLFRAIEKIAFAVMSLGNYSKLGLNYNDVAYEYALYLFERIVHKGYRMFPKDGGNRFPVNKYVTLNIKTVVWPMVAENTWRDSIDDLEALVNMTSEECPEELKGINMDDQLEEYYVGRKLFKILRLHYREEEIYRLLPITLETLDTFKRNRGKLPEDIQDFTVVLITASKRITTDLNLRFTFNPKKKDLDHATKAALKSSIFLSAVCEGSFIDKELLLSMDLESLYRLVSVAGGRTIHIPTQAKLDALLGSVTAITNSLIENKNLREEIYHSKESYNLAFTYTPAMAQTVSKIMEAYNLGDSEGHTKPMISILTQSIHTLDKIYKEIAERIPSTDTPELISTYKELSATFNKMVDALTKVGSSG